MLIGWFNKAFDDVNMNNLFSFLNKRSPLIFIMYVSSLPVSARSSLRDIVEPFAFSFSYFFIFVHWVTFSWRICLLRFFSFLSVYPYFHSLVFPLVFLSLSPSLSLSLFLSLSLSLFCLFLLLVLFLFSFFLFFVSYLFYHFTFLIFVSLFEKFGVKRYRICLSPLIYFHGD